MKQAKLVPVLRFDNFHNEWQAFKLEYVSDKIQDGTHFSPEILENGDCKYVTSKNIRNGYMILDNISMISKDSHDNIYKRCDVLQGDVLLTKDGASTGNVCLNEIEEPISLLSSVAFIRANKEHTLNEYLYQYIVSPRGQKRIFQLIAGQAITRITLSKLRNFKINLPTLPEQQKITNFLTSVDRKIQTLTRKIDLLNDYKKGVMQNIFKQEIRFRDDDGGEFLEWSNEKLSKFLVKYDEKSSFSNQYPVLTSSHRGIFFQKDYFAGKDVASKNNTGYNVVPRDYFTFRHMSDTVVFKFNINTICDRGIVSTLYPVFTTKGMDDRFLQLILNEGAEFKKYATIQKQGGSRTYMYFSKLQKLNLTLPTKKEQTKIANFFSSIDNKINAAQQKLEKMKEWKKGLLQKMFV